LIEAGIIGTGSYLPDVVVTNKDMSGIVETSDEWITTRTGISERHLSSGEPTWFMGAVAAKKALAAAGMDPLDIDLILATTVTPDYYCPSLACIIQAEVGADNAFAFDIGAACSGFVFALDVASKYIGSGTAKNVLIVSAECLSKITDYSDRETCVLFGDGAGAVVISKGQGEILAAHLRSEGKGGGALVSRALAIEHPFLEGTGVNPDGWDSDFQERFPLIDEKFIRMDGTEVYKFAVRAVVDSIQAVIADSGVPLAEIDHFVLHQANYRILEAAARRLGVEMDRFVVHIGEMGNASSASIPICLDNMVRDGRLNKGEKVVMSGFGAGLTYGAMLITY
jgi:3-oxoacyl-[acyl-carrier-protein] synthase-3